LPEWATFHDLRRFYASLVMARACSVKAVQSRLGQQSAVDTLDN
jgi:integrase